MHTRKISMMIIEGNTCYSWCKKGSLKHSQFCNCNNLDGQSLIYILVTLGRKQIALTMQGQGVCCLDDRAKKAWNNSCCTYRNSEARISKLVENPCSQIEIDKELAPKQIIKIPKIATCSFIAGHYLNRV